MTDKGLMTMREFLADHSKITDTDFRMCVQGTHPELPPLRSVKKRAGSREPNLITREAAAEWRALLPDA